MRNKKFGRLLSEGVRSVANRQGKKIGDVEWDIGDQLGFAQATEQYWRRGHIPTDNIVLFLTKYCVHNGRVGYQWSKKFLEQAKYPYPRALLIQLFPSDLHFFLSYQRALEPGQSIALEVAQLLSDKNYNSFFNQPKRLDEREREKLLKRLRQSDYAICLLSPTVLLTKQIRWQLRMLYELWQAGACPQILPVWLGGSTTLIEQLPAPFNSLQWSIWQSEADTPRVIAELEQAAITNSALPLMISTLAQLCREQSPEPLQPKIKLIPDFGRIFRRPHSQLYFSYQEGSDKPLVLQVAEEFKQRDYAISLNQGRKINKNNFQDAQSKLNQADYVIFFLSAEAIYSEVILSELERAQHLRLGAQDKKPRLLAVWLASPAGFVDKIPAAFDALEEWAFWQNESDTPRLVAELEQAMKTGKSLPFRRATLSQLAHHISPSQASSPIVTRQLVGALSPESLFYVEREVDQTALTLLAQERFTLTIKGSRQMGKSSLLQRLAQQAPEVGKRFIWLDCHLLKKAEIETSSFFRYFSDLLTYKLGLANRVSEEWGSLTSALDCTEYVAQEILPHLKRPCILALDGVETLFDTPYQKEFFAMLRIWHNNRTYKDWQSLSLIVTTSTEPHCFIEDLNQSPFNVGTVLDLKDLTLTQVAELNQRYGGPLSDQDVRKVMNLVQGHPYLVQRALYLIANQRYNAQGLLQYASHEQGPFADHLRALFWRLLGKEDLRQAMGKVISQKRCPNDTLLFRLHGAGLVRYREDKQVVPRCQLYADFFKNHIG